MKKVYYLAISLGLFLIILLGGCGGGPSYQTIRYESDGNGFRQFYTNDPQYYNFIFFYTYTNPAIPSDIEAVVKKMSGSPSHGYGIVFGFQDVHNFYEIAINTNRQYSVYKIVYDTPTAIIGWTTSPDLIQGYNQPNTIHWEKVDSTHFTVTFNGGTPISFSDPDYEDGRYGFLTFIGTSAFESFPGTPVDTRFRFSSAVTALDSSNPAQVSVSKIQSTDCAFSNQ